MIIGHRGLPSQYPENTKIGFQKAYEEGLIGIELDIHLSKDNEIVIIHDETLKRTSNMDGEICKLTLKELKKAHIGFNECEGHNDCYMEKIMTIQEFFSTFGDKFNVINIELKTDINEYPGIEKRLLEVLKGYSHMPIKIILSSFNFNTLIRLRKLNKDVELGCLIWEEHNYKDDNKDIIMETCQYLIPSYSLYKKKKHELDVFKKPYMVYTINNKEQYLHIANDKTVKYVISNHAKF